MRSTVWFVCLVACLSLRLATSSPVASSLDSAASLDPALLEPVEENEDRGKRDLGLKAAAGFGIKNFLLDFVFGKVNQVIDYKTRLVTQLDRTNRYKNYYLLNLGTKPRGVATSGAAASAQLEDGVTTTTEDIPVFESNRVSLDLPPQLFGSGFSLVTSISKIVGDVILNTAQRTQRFVDALKPIFGKVLRIETNTIERSKRGNIPGDVARIAEELESRHMQISQRAQSATKS